MTIAINQKIVGYAVVDKTATRPVKPAKVVRPDALPGTTYKIKTPGAALYVTINDQLGEDGKLRPFELFINSKEMAHYQWVTALTRIVSALFRQIDHYEFLVEELRSVYSPDGGFFWGGRFRPSLVSAIGDVLEAHLIQLGLIAKDESHGTDTPVMTEETFQSGQPPKQGEQCPECHQFAVIRSGGCEQCTACSYSRCS